MNTIQFNSPREQHAYETGMREVAAKLKGHRRETYQEMQARVKAEGERMLVKKLGRAGFAKLMGRPAPVTAATTTTRTTQATTATRKTYESGPFSPPKRHCYCTKGLFT